MNNYWHTNYKAGQGGRHVFRFSITSFAGGFSSRDAVARGWEMFSPPVAGQGRGPHQEVLSAPAGALLNLEPVGVPLLAFKQAEDEAGFILRACDFSGVGGNLRLTLPKPAGETFACDLVEANAARQEARGKTVTTPLRRFAPTTIKVRFE